MTLVVCNSSYNVNVMQRLLNALNLPVWLQVLIQCNNNEDISKAIKFIIVANDTQTDRNLPFIAMYHDSHWSAFIYALFTSVLPTRMKSEFGFDDRIVLICRQRSEVSKGQSRLTLSRRKRSTILYLEKCAYFYSNCYINWFDNINLTITLSNA